MSGIGKIRDSFIDPIRNFPSVQSIENTARGSSGIDKLTPFVAGVVMGSIIHSTPIDSLKQLAIPGGFASTGAILVHRQNRRKQAETIIRGLEQLCPDSGSKQAELKARIGENNNYFSSFSSFSKDFNRIKGTVNKLANQISLANTLGEKNTKIFKDAEMIKAILDKPISKQSWSSLVLIVDSMNSSLSDNDKLSSTMFVKQLHHFLHEGLGDNSMQGLVSESVKRKEEYKALVEELDKMRPQFDSQANQIWLSNIMNRRAILTGNLDQVKLSENNDA